MAFRFALRLEDGGDAGDGTFATAAPDWKIGDEFWDREHRRWRLLRILEYPDEPCEGDVHALLVVEPAFRRVTA